MQFKIMYERQDDGMKWMFEVREGYKNDVRVNVLTEEGETIDTFGFESITSPITFKEIQYKLREWSEKGEEE